MELILWGGAGGVFLFLTFLPDYIYLYHLCQRCYGLGLDGLCILWDFPIFLLELLGFFSVGSAGRENFGARYMLRGSSDCCFWDS